MPSLTWEDYINLKMLDRRLDKTKSMKIPKIIKQLSHIVGNEE